MKLTSILTLAISALVFSTLSGCEDTESIDPVNEAVQISEDEGLGLIFMREEEKLARDVYISLFGIYGNKVFDNISSSEQRHMDEVLKLINQFSLTDPALDGIGVFTNQELQQLYDDLMAQGTSDEVAALIVGATIEDVDIRDLEQFIAATTNPDIIRVYEFLDCGSRNHLRAFVGRLDSLGVTYTPQFITREKFDAIINSDKEKCGQGY